MAEDRLIRVPRIAPLASDEPLQPYGVLHGERAIKTIFIDETCPLLGVGWPTFIESHRGAGHQMRERKDS
jgi:hypothetical protein